MNKSESLYTAWQSALLDEHRAVGAVIESGHIGYPLQISLAANTADVLDHMHEMSEEAHRAHLESAAREWEWS